MYINKEYAPLVIYINHMPKSLNVCQWGCFPINMQNGNLLASTM